jgi:hypothetical protein
MRRSLALAEQESRSDLAQKSKCLATHHNVSWTSVYSSKDLSCVDHSKLAKNAELPEQTLPDLKNRLSFL